ERRPNRVTQYTATAAVTTVLAIHAQTAAAVDPREIRTATVNVNVGTAYWTNSTRLKCMKRWAPFRMPWRKIVSSVKGSAVQLMRTKWESIPANRPPPTNET